LKKEKEGSILEEAREEAPKRKVRLVACLRGGEDVHERVHASDFRRVDAPSHAFTLVIALFTYMFYEINNRALILLRYSHIFT